MTSNIRQQEYLTGLPVKLLDEIGNSIQEIGNLKAFATTSRCIHNIISASIIRRDPMKAMIHYAAVNDISGIQRALSAGANVNALYKLEENKRKKLFGADKLIWVEEFMPLHIAAIMESVDAAAYLLEQGASINATAGHRKITAFRLANEFESLAMMRLLHRMGSDIDRGDCYGTTPLHVSSKKRQRRDSGVASRSRH